MNSSQPPVILLIADDDPDDRLLARDALAECGVPVDLRCVENGVELLDYLLQRERYELPGLAPRPRLILLDLNMPRKGGAEALAEIKAHPALKRIPVVVLTTSRAETDIARLYDLGANSFIVKPNSFDDLVERMRVIGKYWLEMVELPGRKP